MEEVFEEVLALCLDRVSDGDSAEACAAEFPEFSDLLPLLQLATSLWSLPREEPSPGWLASPGDRVRGPARLFPPPSSPDDRPRPSPGGPEPA